MSWQLSAFVLLGLVIAGGVAWYERSHPPARVVALVAALAALAVAGRLVLAPIPNVVATTDVALLTGYALGGAPGFAVGALAAPVSNLWLGQGPWTPWQMAGWGLCGLAGAGLARLSGRRLGRLGLAISCAGAGFAYGALLDLSVMVSYGGEQSLDRYLALSARGIPFNVAHAAGNFAIALAAGPALVRMISRFGERLEFTWHREGALARAAPLLVVGAIVGLGALAGPAPPGAAGAEAAGHPPDARRWLEHAQNADGGFAAAPGQGSSARMTSWAILGLEAAGRNPLDLRRGGDSPVDWLRARADRLNAVNDLELAILSLGSAGVSPSSFGGQNLVAELQSKRSGDGSFGPENLTAFGIFALRAAGVPQSKLAGSATWLRKAQNRDGGWGSSAGAQSDSDTTGAVMQALVTASGRGPASARGARYLRGVQRSDGGFPLLSGGASNSQSTAWAVQGLIAAGAEPGSFERGGHDPFEYLNSRQAADGHYTYSEATDQSPVWVTAQVLPALARSPFPLGRVPRASEPGGLPAPAGPAAKQHSGAGPEGGAGTGAGERGGRGGAGRGGEGGRGRRPAEDGTAGRRQGNEGGATERELTAARLPGEEATPGSGSGAHDDFPIGPTLIGLGLLAAGLGAGFLWYRRRLP